MNSKLSQLISFLAKKDISLVTIILVYLETVIALMDYLFYKDDKIIVFGSNTGQYASGSPKALFDYIRRNHPEYRVHFYKPFDKSRGTVSKINYIMSYATLFFRAKFLVSSHPPTDFFPYLSWSKKKVLINTWHGTPFKSIFFTDKSETKLDLYRLMRLNQRTSAFLVSSNLEIESIKKCFLIDQKKIYCLGHPRNDVLLEMKKLENLPILVKKIPEYTKVILYCPTYRHDKSVAFFPFDDFDPKHFNRFLEENKIIVLIRAHYYDLKLGDNLFSDRIVHFGFDVCEDINPILPEVDILVTDYSSIYIDYLLLDKPMIFIPYDLENFKKNHGFLFEYDSWTPGPKILTYKQFTIRIQEIMSGIDEYKNQRRMLKMRNHSCQTNNSCEKVFELIDQWKG